MEKKFYQAMWKLAGQSNLISVVNEWEELAYQFEEHYNGYEEYEGRYYVDLVSPEEDLPVIYGSLDNIMGVDYVGKLTCVFEKVGKEMKLVKMYPVEDDDEEEEDD